MSYEYRKKLGGTYNHFDDDRTIWGQIFPTDVKSALMKGNSVSFDATNVAKKQRSVLNWTNGTT